MNFTGDLVHVMASEDSTTVTRQYSASNRPGAPVVLNKGETHILNLLPGFLMHVVADKPIQVTHLTKSHVSGRFSLLPCQLYVTLLYLLTISMLDRSLTLSV